MIVGKRDFFSIERGEDFFIKETYFALFLFLFVFDSTARSSLSMLKSVIKHYCSVFCRYLECENLVLDSEESYSDRDFVEMRKSSSMRKDS